MSVQASTAFMVSMMNVCCFLTWQACFDMFYLTMSFVPFLMFMYIFGMGAYYNVC